MQVALISVLQTEPEPDSGLSPAVIGGLFVVIGIVLTLIAIRGLSRGVTKDKYGNEYSGGKAKLISGVRLALGVFLIGAGFFRLLTG